MERNKGEQELTIESALTKKKQQQKLRGLSCWAKIRGEQKKKHAEHDTVSSTWKQIERSRERLKLK